MEGTVIGEALRQVDRIDMSVDILGVPRGEVGAAMPTRLCLGILGPLVVEADGRRLKIASARQRVILALLALFPDQVVTVDSMVDSIWPGRAPATARTQVSICVAALRRLFASVGAVEDLIVTEFPGYRLNSAGVEIDRVLMEKEVARAERAIREGGPAEAERRFSGALGLWRGPALSGIRGMVPETEAARLDERRLDVRDAAVEVLLELGEYDRALADAAATAREQPLREHTVRLLMLAQCRSGRRAEALDTFRRTRRLFVTDLGVEPGPELARLHAAILRDDPALSPAPVGPAQEDAAAASATAQRAAVFVVPSELPPDTYGFVGRAAELAALDLLCTSAEAGYGPTVGLISGAAGVGKSCLAVHWAHEAADSYPDGRLFADLRGVDEQHGEATTAEILSRFLRSLGVDSAQIPGGLAERTALYRSVLRGRKLLVLLDNASSFDQVRTLVPSSSGCTALITGRGHLQSLMAAPSGARIHLGVLTRPEALELFAGIVGAERVAAAAGDADRIVDYCDLLPLVVRIAGARLAAKPHWTVARLANRLSDEGRRLDELSEGDVRVRDSFELSYRDLDPDAALIYQLLSLLDVADFAAWVGAALLGVPLDQAEQLIERLVDCRLLEVVGVDGSGWLRYRFQRLLRLYARERAGQGGAVDLEGAVDRAMGSYLWLAMEAHRREYGGDFSVLRVTGHCTELSADLAQDLLARPLVRDGTRGPRGDRQAGRAVGSRRDRLEPDDVDGLTVRGARPCRRLASLLRVRTRGSRGRGRRARAGLHAARHRSGGAAPARSGFRRRLLRAGAEPLHPDR